MALFDKFKKTPGGKTVPLGPPNVEKMEEEGLKDEVGFPLEEHEEFPAQEETLGGEEQYSADFPEETEREPTSTEEPLAPPPSEYPDFLPPPPGLPVAPPPGASSAEELKNALRSIVDEIRADFDEKISAVSAELEEIKKIEENIHQLSEDFNELKKKYEELEEKQGGVSDEELVAIKTSINEINSILKTALPALIKEIRDQKTQKFFA